MVLVKLALSMQKMKIDHSLSPCTMLKCKWIKDLHIKPATLKLLDEKVEKTLELIGLGENFLNRITMAQALRSKIDQWDLIRLQSLCKASYPVKKRKWQPTQWEKFFINPTSDTDLISKVYKELKKLDTRESINPIKKWGYRAKQKVLN